MASMTAGKLIQSLLSYSYGFLTFFYFLYLAARDGSLFFRTSEKEKNELAIARSKLWNLSSPSPNFFHAFFTLRNGRKLHYVCNNLHVSNPANLIIFVHGFPDSYHIWTTFLESSRLRQSQGRDNVLIALDLPGYGGSEGLSGDSLATNVLEALTEFIVGVRDRFLYGDIEKPGNSVPNVIYVGHDWGCILGFRLAWEAPQLADRFILSNAPHPPLMAANFIRATSSFEAMIKRSIYSRFSSISLAKAAVGTLSPLLRQAKMSSYTFVFNLPLDLASFAGSMGNFWFLRHCNEIALSKGHPFESTAAAEAMASSLGPGLDECQTKTPDGQSYPKSVTQNATSGGFLNKIRYYREGMFAGQWQKSLETLADLHSIGLNGTTRRSSSGAGLIEDGPKGALSAPVTIVWGQKDLMLDQRIALDGIADYFARKSQVVMLPRSGHWTSVEQESQKAFERVVEWAAGGKEDLGRMIQEVYRDARITVQK